MPFELDTMINLVHEIASCNWSIANSGGDTFAVVAATFNQRLRSHR